MKVRTAVLGTVAALVVSLVTFAPANAAVPDAPTFSGLSTDVGHLTGTISSDSPFVRVVLGFNPPVNLPTVSGALSLDLATWGYRGESTVRAYACPTAAAEAWECSEPVEETFTAQDVRPTITWDTDGSVGQSETLDVIVSDPHGGGAIKAGWEFGGLTVDLNRNGTTHATPTDGAGTFFAARCASAAEDSACTTFDPAIEVELKVRRNLRLTSTGGWYATTNAPVPQITLGTDGIAGPLSGSFQVTWHLRVGSLTAKSGNASGTIGPTGDIVFPVDPSGLPDGDYILAVTVSVQDPAFGSMVDSAVFFPPLMVRRGFVVTEASANRTKIWPLIRKTKYPGTATITVTASTPVRYDGRLEVFDAAGNFVRSLDTNPTIGNESQVKGTWDGRRSSGAVAPAGTYDVRLVDDFGNKSQSGVRIVVSTQRYVLKTFKKTVTASGSLDSKYIGKCSVLRRPSLRGWAGSLGFYANTKCRTQTWVASAASTVHAIKVPSAAEYYTVQVSIYGGAAKSARRSRGFIRYLNTKRQWIDESTVSAALGNHDGPRDSATPLVWSDQYFVWGFATAYKQRYDVKTFTVTLRYYVVE